MNTIQRLLRVAFAIGAMAYLGCGGDASSGKIPIKGKLLENGAPFVFDNSKLKLPKGATSAPPGSNPLQVVFTATDGSATELATVDLATGTFELRGLDGKGVKPGQYKVSITASMGGGAPDLFGGKFSPEKTPITRELKEGTEIVIDVAKPNG